MVIVIIIVIVIVREPGHAAVLTVAAGPIVITKVI